MSRPEILIVEDETIIAMNTRVWLEEFGYKVAGITATGEGAIRRIKKTPPDLVLVDIFLKGDMDGIEVGERLRLLDIPVIYLTAHADEKTTERAKLTEPYGYILKPYEKEELHIAVEIALTKHGMEKKLKESEDRYRIAIEGSNDGVAIVQDLAHIYVNQRFLTMFRYDSLDEIVGNPPYFNVHPEDFERVKNYALLRAEGIEVPSQYEFRGMRRDGTAIDIEVSVNTITYQGRDAILAYLRDITDRKGAEEELKKSEIRYRSLIESSPDAILLHDGERVLYSNPAAMALFGAKEARRLVGRKILDLIQSDCRDTVAHAIDSLKDAGRAASIAGVKLVRDDGEIAHVECMGSPVDYGGPKRFLITMRDITVRLQTEEALSKTWHQQKAILDNIPDIAWLKDRESRFILTNEPFGKACGVRPEDLTGKTDLDVWPKDLAKKYRADDSEVMQSGRRRQIEEQVTDKDGTTIVVETIKTAVFDDRGEVIGTAGIARDITQRKQQEGELRQYRERLEQLVEERTAALRKVNTLLKQELTEHTRTEAKVQALNGELERRITELDATNRELETFNYSVSHDLRTPLVAIEGFSRILLEKHSHSLDAKAQQFLGIISKNTRRMSELIEDLLSFFSVGRKPIRFSSIDMDKMVNDVVTDFKTLLPTTSFVVECAAIPPAYGDRKMIRQVLINLMGNAIKYSKSKGMALITVGGWVEEEKNVYYLKDQGIGFSMEQAERIFEVFERLHSSEEFEGSGLGLAIVKRVVHKHGGDVWAEGCEHEGATFYFSLPGRGE